MKPTYFMFLTLIVLGMASCKDYTCVCGNDVVGTVRTGSLVKATKKCKESFSENCEAK